MEVSLVETESVGLCSGGIFLESRLVPFTWVGDGDNDSNDNGDGNGNSDDDGKGDDDNDDDDGDGNNGVLVFAVVSTTDDDVASRRPG